MEIRGSVQVDGLDVLFPESSRGPWPVSQIRVDLVANAFYFLSSWYERFGADADNQRCLYSNSLYARFKIPQDIVDQYLVRLLGRLAALCERLSLPPWAALEWPENRHYALVLSHDVDYIPENRVAIVKQALKTVLRHLFRHHDPDDALRAAIGALGALVRNRDPYGCVHEIIAREIELGTRSSFQVAVGRRDPRDVNYLIEDDNVRDYLRAIPDAGFDLCLHGSCRSTENPTWYLEEAALLADRLGAPMGSRQHFLSFDYDGLFAVQEQAGIQYDMSMGYPDQCGPRAGFSFPYFPYSVHEDRPYDVLQINLFLMDVTLRSYLRQKPPRAWESIQAVLDDLKRKRGCVSVVWHPIVFGGARDPGYDSLYWRMIEYTGSTGGLTTDGKSINTFWRSYAKNYMSFSDKTFQTLQAGASR